jgi:hypothetical protein
VLRFSDTTSFSVGRENVRINAGRDATRFQQQRESNNNC